MKKLHVIKASQQFAVGDTVEIFRWQEGGWQSVGFGSVADLGTSFAKIIQLGADRFSAAFEWCPYRCKKSFLKKVS